jgi:phosphoglycerate dehydrogenase-like enzyme
VFTPHAAGYTRGMGQTIADAVTETLRVLQAGEEIPDRVVPPDH